MIVESKMDHRFFDGFFGGWVFGHGDNQSPAPGETR